MTRVRLTKKLAAVVNGVDISALAVGETAQLPDRAAQMLVAEGWAELDDVAAQSSVRQSADASTEAD